MLPGTRASPGVCQRAGYKLSERTIWGTGTALAFTNVNGDFRTLFLEQGIAYPLWARLSILNFTRLAMGPVQAARSGVTKYMRFSTAELALDFGDA